MFEKFISWKLRSNQECHKLCECALVIEMGCRIQKFIELASLSNHDVSSNQKLSKFNWINCLALLN